MAVVLLVEFDGILSLRRITHIPVDRAHDEELHHAGGLHDVPVLIAVDRSGLQVLIADGPVLAQGCPRVHDIIQDRGYGTVVLLCFRLLLRLRVRNDVIGLCLILRLQDISGIRNDECFRIFRTQLERQVFRHRLRDHIRSPVGSVFRSRLLPVSGICLSELLHHIAAAQADSRDQRGRNHHMFSHTSSPSEPS